MGEVLEKSQDKAAYRASISIEFRTTPERQIEPLPKAAGSFGLVGYYWPKSIPLPAVAPVPMPAGAPAHQISVT